MLPQTPSIWEPAPTHPSTIVTDSHTIIHPGNPASKILLTCEHASARFPEPWPTETTLVNTHWAVDLGAEDATLSLSKKLNAPALLARFSRLVIDVNRPLDSDTLFRSVADGKPVSLNVNITEQDKKTRIERFWVPYRSALSTLLKQYPNVELVLSMHSFTPCYEGNVREMHIGVLFMENETLATIMNNHFNSLGYNSKLNEPWHGNICDVLITTEKNGYKGLVIELRQDLAVQPQWRSKIEDEIVKKLKSVGLC